MRETYFVNNNFSVKSLTQTNYAFQINLAVQKIKTTKTN